MRISVLGPLEVRTDDGDAVPVPGAKERLLLAVLAAAAPAVVPADRLADVLWDGHPPPTARKSLQAHLVHLRSALEPGRPRGSPGRWVVRRGPGYSLAVARGDLDVLAAADLAAHGRALLAGGDPAAAVAALDGALGLWRGEPYCDWPGAPFAEGERRRLAEVRAGARAARAEARLALGDHAEHLPELEVLVAEDPLREDSWRLLVLALYRGGRQGDALAACRRARQVLADELGADPGPALRALEAAVLAQDPALDVPAAPAPAPAAPGRCPYKGLAVYGPDDAALLHGRSRLVAGLVARLVDTPLLVVTGPSGAGKSSAVRAGVVPALAAGALPGSERWRPVVLSPGRSPVDALACLESGAPAAPVLLVCDQLEQVWTADVDPAEREAFLDALLGLMDDGVAARCVLVVRSDHVGRLAEHAGLAERLGGAVVLVPALSAGELAEVVTGPAADAGLVVEPELVEAVVADGLGRAGALPMLSTALVGTWERRAGVRLTLAGYLAVGGVSGALARSAEAAYAALDDGARTAARGVLVRLADADDRGTLVRRAVPSAEIGPVGAAPRRVVETLVARRLLTVDGDRVEVAHEALLTAWPRLARWLEEDAAARAVRRHLAPVAADWDAAGRPDEELYRGARLAAALDVAAAGDGAFTGVERDFLEASRGRADAELRAARDHARAEARGRRRTRRLAAGLAAVLVIALAATVLAVRFQRAADDRAAQAETNSRVADGNWLSSQIATAGSLDTALLLAAQAVRLADTPATRDGLSGALVESRRVARAVPYPGRVVSGSLGGPTLFLGIGRQVVAWDWHGAAPPAVAATLDGSWEGWRSGEADPVGGRLANVGVAESGPWLRVLSATGEVRDLLTGPALGGSPLAVGWSAAGDRVRVLVAAPGPQPGTAQWRVTEVAADGGGTPATVAAGPLPGAPGGWEALGDPAGTFVLRDPVSGRAPLVLDARAGTTAPLAVPDRSGAELTGLRPLPGGAAALWSDGVVTRFDTSGRTVQEVPALQAPVRDVAMSVRGGWAAAVGDNGAVVRWDVDPAGQWTSPEVLAGHRGDVLEAEADPAGRSLLTAGADHTVVVWDMTPDGVFGADYPAVAGRWVSNRPAVVDPGALVVAPTRSLPASGTLTHVDEGEDTLDVSATFFEPGTGRVVDSVPVGRTLPLTLFGSSVSVSPDRRFVAVTWGLGTTVLDARTRAPVATVQIPADTPVPEVGILTAEPVWCTGWTPDGTRLLIGTETDLLGHTGGVLTVVDTATWQVTGQEVDVGITPQVLEPSPDGRLLAVAASGAPEVVLLDGGTLAERSRIELASDDLTYDLAFSPDGRLLAAAGDRGDLHLLDVVTGAPARDPVPVHGGEVLQVEWLADGRTIATAGIDGTVALYDVDRGLLRGRPLPATASGGPAYAHLVPGTPGELVTVPGERPGRRYPLDPAGWLRAACAVAERDLTRAEWDRYLPGRPWQPTCSDLR